MVLNIRDNTLTSEDTVTATVYTSPCGFTAPTSTGIIATRNGPSNSEDPHCVATAFGSVPVSAGSLLSVRIDMPEVTLLAGALSNGVAVTVLMTTP